MISEYVKGYLASEESERDKITIKKLYIKINDNNLYDGLLFSQIMYWHGRNKETGQLRMKVKKNNHLWIAKSYNEWADETCMKEHTVRKVLDRLRSKNLIYAELFKFNGRPVLHVRMNWEEFEARLKALIDPTCPYRSNGFDTTGQIHLIPQVNSLTDTTSDTTSDNKSSFSYENEDTDFFQQSEIIVESKSEQEIKDQMNAVGVIDLLDMLDENNGNEISNTNLTADSKHPAIIAWRNVNKRYPKKDLYEFVANGLGSNPDEDILKYVCQKWKASGYNPTNIDGQIEWYKQAVTWYKAGNSLDSFSPRYNNFVTKDNNEFTGTLRGLTFE